MKIRDWSLPQEYEYMQYIKTVENDTAYINTEFGTGLNSRYLEMEIKFATWGGYNNVSASIIGARENANSNNLAIFASGATPNQLVLRYRKGTTGNVNYNSYVRENQYVAQILNDGNYKRFYLNNNLIGSVALSNGPDKMYDLYLCACNEGNSGTISNTNGIKVIYYCKLWYEKTLVRDFIPVRRKTDGKIGLFDKITNKFYISPNGQNFII